MKRTRESAVCGGCHEATTEGLQLPCAHHFCLGCAWFAFRSSGNTCEAILSVGGPAADHLEGGLVTGPAGSDSRLECAECGTRVSATELEDGWLALLLRHPKEARGEKEQTTIGLLREQLRLNDNDMSVEDAVNAAVVGPPPRPYRHMLFTATAPLMSLRDLVGGNAGSEAPPCATQTTPSSVPAQGSFLAVGGTGMVPSQGQTQSQSGSGLAPLSDTEGSQPSPQSDMSQETATSATATTAAATSTSTTPSGPPATSTEPTRSAEGPPVDPMTEVEILFQRGLACEKAEDGNLQEAHDCYKRAAELGHVEAAYRYGVCLKHGKGAEKNPQTAFAWFMKAAEAGLAPAQYNVGWCYRYGCGVTRNYDLAFQWYCKAAEQRYPHGMFAVGKAYSKGWGVEQDPQKAFEWYTRAAEAGSGEAQCNLGCCYARGQGTPKDMEKARDWYARAAEMGNVPAQANLGVMYLKGDGIPADVPKALTLLAAAGHHGNLKAQFHLGTTFFFGTEEVERDYTRAAEWFQKGAEQGDAVCAFNVGVMYNNALGVEKNLREAVRWLLLAEEKGYDDVPDTMNDIIAESAAELIPFLTEKAEQGSALGQYYLSVAYVRLPTPGTKTAAYWCQRAADQGHREAMHDLANFLISGDGVERNIERGISWLKTAIDAGSVDSIYRLGLLYYEGNAVGRDHRKAFKYFSRAARAGDTAACYRVGKMFARGIGVEKNGKKATKWFTRAAAQGHVGALYAEAVLWDEGVLVPRDDVRAALKYQQALTYQYEKAYRPLADMYRDGRGLVQDLERAKKLYRMAARGGDTLAQKRLEELVSTLPRGEDAEPDDELLSLAELADEGDEEARGKLAALLARRWGRVVDNVFRRIA